MPLKSLAALRLLPPHSRGCTYLVPVQPVFSAASPALAGMYPNSHDNYIPQCGFPRTRGDVP